jgi:hypothetical protein
MLKCKFSKVLHVHFQRNGALTVHMFFLIRCRYAIGVGTLKPDEKSHYILAESGVVELVPYVLCFLNYVELCIVLSH